MTAERRLPPRLLPPIPNGAEQMMIGGWAMLAMGAIVPVENAGRFDLAGVRPAVRSDERRMSQYLLPDVDEPAPPEKARFRVRGRMVKWRVPLRNF